jgi:hypothetical protein
MFKTRECQVTEEGGCESITNATINCNTQPCPGELGRTSQKNLKTPLSDLCGILGLFQWTEVGRHGQRGHCAVKRVAIKKKSGQGCATIPYRGTVANIVQAMILKSCHAMTMIILNVQVISSPCLQIKKRFENLLLNFLTF